MIIFIISAICH